MPVHPRSAGNTNSAMTRGSSPRVRGTPPQAPVSACAGNLFLRPGVHVCGEHMTPGSSPRVRGTLYQLVYMRADYQFVYGSSPRVRGTHSSAHRLCAVRRFIPACAGNTLLRHSGGLNRPVHPRVCGEHVSQGELRRDATGSSPRVRGTPLAVSSDVTVNRFIPACAGNTAAASVAVPALPVHPRVCGEHALPAESTARVPGSSPRVRGTQTKKAEHGPRLRGTAVHPRVCGEHG